VLQGYESVSIDPEDFEGQSVLILGRGLFAAFTYIIVFVLMCLKAILVLKQLPTLLDQQHLYI